MTDRELVNEYLAEIAPATVQRWGADQCALDQDFNDWTDGLCKAGQITSAQYNRVGMPDLTDRQWVKLLEGTEVQL